MPKRHIPLALPRIATVASIVLVLGYAAASLLTQIGTPLPDFAASYVATSVAIHMPGAPMYDYGTLLRLNAVHQYVTVSFYPFVAPPFALLALAPLAFIPFPLANVLWLGITRLCALGAALAVSDAVYIVIARRSMVETSSSRRLLAVLRMTSLRIGRWRSPAGLVPLCSLVLLLALSPLDAISWDSLALVAVLFVALALDAYIRGHQILAALAIAVASGFSFFPLMLVVCFFFRGTWKVTIAALLFAAAVAAAPLLILPARTYSDLASALRMVQAAYGSSDHNISLSGATSIAVSSLGHMGTHTFTWASDLGTPLSLVLIAATLIAVLISPAVRRSATKAEKLPGDYDSIWLIFAIALSAAVLALPMVWPADSAFALFAMLLVGMYPFIRSLNRSHNTSNSSAGQQQHVSDIHAAVLFLLAATALILYLTALMLRLDSTDLRLLDHREFLFVARPAASVITWAAALRALFAPSPRLLRRRPHTIGATAEHDALSRV